MPQEFTFAPKFKLIVEHLKAVRTLDEYVHGVGLEKDMQDLANYLRRDLSRGVLSPARWEDLEKKKAKGDLYSSPLGDNALLPKWSVVEEDVIGIRIAPTWPVRDDNGPTSDSTVNLYVPQKLGQTARVPNEARTTARL